MTVVGRGPATRLGAEAALQEAIQRIRAEAGLAHVPILAVTARSIE